jgi:hypothetical protein
MVLALSLFLGAIAVLAQIVWNGQRAALAARLRTEAAFRCEAQLGEILAGALPFQPQQNVAFPDDPQWTWSAEIGPGNLPELMQVKVTVHHESKNPAAIADFSLERWTRDPSLYTQSALDQQIARGSTSSSTQGSTSSTTQGGSR